ncbi:MAG: ABC transporter ATP-binding protein, partial [Lentisphaeria bacterium]|nr:ABC transporter ATP-binding protein [Lentisphaeria bacterium]
MLKAQNLKKNYGEITALDSLSLSVEPGQVVGL